MMVGRRLICIAALVAASALPTSALATSARAATTARADTYTDAAVQVLRELTELHVRQFAIACVPHAQLQRVAPPPGPSEVTLGLARVRGKALYLDRALVCAPLLGYYLERGAVQFSDRLLLGLDAVAVTYGFTLGLRRYDVAECYGVRVVWKWVERSDPGYDTAVQARRFLLDNSYRPVGYKLKPSCTLPQPQ
jgi:hypothetical protein